MEAPETLEKKPRGRIELSETRRRELWAIVLAGGEGVRLRALTRRLYGEDRPKQYAVLFGSRSLLRKTLDRVALAIPPERTVVVTLRSHAGYIAAELAGSPTPRVLVQPENRGTAAGVLFPAHWIQWRDPEATVVVFPSDHFIVEETVFMDHLTGVVTWAGHSEWIVLLGAQPTEPETEYGWIEPGDPLAWTPAGPICWVHRFWEKPSAERARAFLDSGYLWNTLVIVAKASALVEAGRRFLPDLHERLSRIAPFVDTEDEPWAVQQAYHLINKANFSQSILQRCPPRLVVSKLPALTWCDWGTPERVLKSLRTAGIPPAWSAGLDLSA